MRFSLCCRPPLFQVVLAVSCFSFGTVSGQPLPSLFFDDGSSIVALHHRGDSTNTSARSRLARVDAAVLWQLKNGRGREVSCRLNLFAGIEPLVTVRMAETSDDNYGVHAGTIAGEPNSQVMLVTRGELLAGSVLIPGRGSFQIVPQGRVCLLKELRLPTLPLCGRPIPDEFQRPIETSRHAKLAAQGAALDSGTNHVLEAPASTEPREIEVMMLYTSAAKEAASGTEAMEALARLSVEEANAALANSNTGVRFRVVHIGEIEYEASGDLWLDLQNLRFTSDGVMDEVHALRDQYEADLVSLVVERSNSYSGLGYPATAPQNGFSVINVSFLGSGLAAHEFGHNLGCDHDRENASGIGAFTFSYGHRFDVDGITYRCVMSYAPGWPIPHYSNPDIAFRGVPTGIPEGEPGEADNARTIRAMAAFVDSYRGVSVDLVQPSNGAVFAAGKVIELAAVVSSHEGPVVSVDFLVGELLLGEVGAAPYNFSWVNPAPGKHVLSARTRINGGVVQQSRSIVVGVTPVNDYFADRLPVSGSNVTANTVLYAATQEPGEPVGMSNSERTAWWSWSTPVEGLVRVSVSGPTMARPRAAIFSGRTLQELKPVQTTGALSKDILFHATAHEEYQICLVGEPSTEAVSLYITMEAPPPNDDFANADRIDFLSGTIRGSTVAATAEPGEPSIGSHPFGHSIWFHWSPSIAGQAILTQTAGKAETDFAVYSGTNLASLKLVASSAVARQGFAVQARETYRIAVDGAFQAISIALNVQPRAVNDSFGKRTPMNASGAFISVVHASREPGEPSHGTTRGGHSQWWTWRAPSEGGVRISRPFVGYGLPDLSVAWYTGTALTNLLRVASCDFTNSFPESFIVPVRRSTNYIIALDSSASVNQSVRFEFRSTAPNDNFRQRQPFASSRTTGTTLGATAEPGERAHGGLAAEHSAWWSWSVPTNRAVSVTVDSTGDILPRLSVYSGDSTNNLSLVTENMAGGQIGPTVTFAAEAGRRYAFAIDESISSFSYSLLLNTAVPPSNNDFERAQTLPGNAQLVPGSTIAATLQPEEPQHLAAEVSGSVWYTLTTASEAEVTVLAGGRRPQTEGEMRATLPEPIVAVYQGITLASLTPVHAGVGAATFRPGRNVRYHIAIASPAAQQDFALSIVLVRGNDRFENALLLPENGVSTVSPTVLRSATKQPDEPNHAGQASGHSLWWTWIPRRSGDYRWRALQQFSVNPRPVALVMAAYTGTQMTNLTLVASNLWDNLSFPAQAGKRYYLALDLKDPRVTLSQTTFGGLSLSLSRYPTFLTPALRPGQGIEFVLAGSAGQAVALETSDDLVHWEVLRELVLPGSDYRYLEPYWSILSQKFFRVLLK